MNDKEKNLPANKYGEADLELAFDVGHSSVGWAVLDNNSEFCSASFSFPGVRASGVLLFPSDDCLASVRRQLRGQRRHARATRKRIERIARFLLRVLSKKQKSNATLIKHLEYYLDSNPQNRANLQGKGHPAPWLLAARVLCGGDLLDWSQFWDVLRWYAHNRGYDDNVPWARQSENRSPSDQAQQAQEQDRKRQARAIALMKCYGTKRMAETVFCYLFDEADSGRCDFDPRKVDRLPFFQRYFKEEECIFPRETVKEEVRQILNAHRTMIESAGISPNIFIDALLDDWRVLPEEFLGTPESKNRIWLPKRYGTRKTRHLPDGRVRQERTHAGLLFGQLIPRFENRIISTCPFTFARRYIQFLNQGVTEEQWRLLPKSWKSRIRPHQSLAEEIARHLARIAAKVPTRASREFLQYRWTMLLADLAILGKSNVVSRRLSANERKHLDNEMQKRGTFSVDELRELISIAAPGCEAANLDDIFHETPERAKELFVDPAKNFAASSELAKNLFPLLPDRLQRRVLNELRRGRSLKPSSLLELLKQFGYVKEASDFEAKVQWLQDAENLNANRGGRGKSMISARKAKSRSVPILERILKLKPLSGRARYHREILKQAAQEVLDGFDPNKKALDPKNPDDKSEQKTKDGCLVETPEMVSLALGHASSGESAETAFPSWLEKWRKKRSRRGELANETLFQKYGEACAREVYEARTSNQWLSGQTNNHLLRQRLLLLRRLTDDIIVEFANGKAERIAGVTIEVARDLLAFSGLQKKDIGSDTKGALKSIKAQHYRVEEKLRREFAPEGKEYLITGELLWKAKIADDLGWRCPYTNDPISGFQLAKGEMDIDHIIPRSKRLTNAMEACVITYKGINQKKKNMTALEFVTRFQTKHIGSLTKGIRRLDDYLNFVKNLKLCRPPKARTQTNGESELNEEFENDNTGAIELNPKYLPGTDRLHPDYIRRRKRQRLLKIKSASDEDLGFTRRDLTITSHLNRLAQFALLRALPHLRPNDFVSLPGVVTGSVRDMGGWQLLGLLGRPNVCGERAMRKVKKINYETKEIERNPQTGEELWKEVPRKKNELRKLTHLHHAIDACTLGMLAHILPKDGKLWEYIAVGDLTEIQAADFGKRSQEFKRRGHPFSSLFTLVPIPENEREEESEKPRTHRVRSIWNKQNKELLHWVKESIGSALEARRVRLHIPAERNGMPTNQTVYRVLTSLNAPGYIPQLARAVLSAKEEQLKRLDEAVANEKNKGRLKKLSLERDALAKLLNRLKDFVQNVWLINRVRKDSETGKDVINRLKEYEDWRRRNNGERAPEAADETSQEDLDADAEEDAAKSKKSNRKKREPNLLRPFNPDKHKLLYLFDVVSRDRVIGLPPDNKIAQARLLPLKAGKELGANFAAVIFPPIEVNGEKQWRDGKEIIVLPFFRVHHSLEQLKAQGKKIQLLRNGALIHVPKGDRYGWWRVISVKDTEAYGKAVDLAAPDGVEKIKGNAPLTVLLKEGMKIISSPLTGHDIRR